MIIWDEIPQEAYRYTIDDAVRLYEEQGDETE